MTQKALAKRLKTSPDTIGRIESGQVGTTYRKNVGTIIKTLRVTDAEERMILKSAVSSRGGPPVRPAAWAATSSKIAVLRPADQSETNEDILVSALCAAIERGSVTGDQAIEAAKQVEFIRGHRWHDM